jgi:hypothetical protein
MNEQQKPVSLKDKVIARLPERIQTTLDERNERFRRHAITRSVELFGDIIQQPNQTEQGQLMIHSLPSLRSDGILPDRYNGISSPDRERFGQAQSEVKVFIDRFRETPPEEGNSFVEYLTNDLTRERAELLQLGMEQFPNEIHEYVHSSRFTYDDAPDRPEPPSPTDMHERLVEELNNAGYKTINMKRRKFLQAAAGVVFLGATTGGIAEIVSREADKLPRSLIDTEALLQEVQPTGDFLLFEEQARDRARAELNKILRLGNVREDERLNKALLGPESEIPEHFLVTSIVKDGIARGNNYSFRFDEKTEINLPDIDIELTQYGDQALMQVDFYLNNQGILVSGETAQKQNFTDDELKALLAGTFEGVKIDPQRKKYPIIGGTFHQGSETYDVGITNQGNVYIRYVQNELTVVRLPRFETEEHLAAQIGYLSVERDSDQLQTTLLEYITDSSLRDRVDRLLDINRSLTILNDLIGAKIRNPNLEKKLLQKIHDREIREKTRVALPTPYGEYRDELFRERTNAINELYDGALKE